MNKPLCHKLRGVTGILLIFIAVVLFPYGFKPGGGIVFGKSLQQPSKLTLTDDELHLYKLMMNHRRKNGLASIPVSNSLSYVAQLHVRDLEMHPPSGSCSIHSWSEYGSWTSFCDSDIGSDKYMWSKPAELTNYKGKGYEIAAWTSGRMNPDTALSLWADSPEHNAIITNDGNWKNRQWNAVGVAISGHYAVVWFGKELENERKAARN
jgi:hypothetical protein